MTLNEFAKEAHENAVKHGFWEEKHEDFELFALIHSEWSEALEEYRAGRPPVWYQCVNWEMPRDKDAHCVEAGKQSVECIGRECCKPEGIAVELIDGALRILDIAGRLELELDDAFKEAEHIHDKEDEEMAERIRSCTLPKIVGLLHVLTVNALDILVDSNILDCEDRNTVSYAFALIIYTAFTWVETQSVDPWEIMKEKHEYNKTRPYRHGGKKC